MRTQEDIKEAAELMLLTSAYLQHEKPDSTCAKWKVTYEVALALEWVTGEDNSFGQMINDMRQVETK